MAWTSQQTRNLVVGIALALGLTSGCKPKGSASLKTITGVDQNGREVAFGLLTVVNWTPAPISNAASDAGVAYAEALVRSDSNFFAQIECVAGEDSTGKTLSAQEWVEFARMQAMMNQLRLNYKRNVMFPLGGAHFPLPCRTVGTRLASFKTMYSMLSLIDKLPVTKPADADELRKIGLAYLGAQSVFLALRGPYTPATSVSLEPMLTKFTKMLAKNRIDSSKIPWSDTFKRLDLAFNPCVDDAGGSWYAAAWKNTNFACVPADGTTKGAFVYRAGGTDGSRYSEVRDTVAGVIAATHEVTCQASRAGRHDKLWNVLSSTQSFDAWTGDEGAIGKYLSGNGPSLDFADYFSASNKDSGSDTTSCAPVRGASLTGREGLALAPNGNLGKTWSNGSYIWNGRSWVQATQPPVNFDAPTANSRPQDGPLYYTGGTTSGMNSYTSATKANGGNDQRIGQTEYVGTGKNSWQDTSLASNQQAGTGETYSYGKDGWSAKFDYLSSNAKGSNSATAPLKSENGYLKVTNGDEVAAAYDQSYRELRSASRAQVAKSQEAYGDYTSADSTLGAASAAGSSLFESFKGFAQADAMEKNAKTGVDGFNKSINGRFAADDMATAKSLKADHLSDAQGMFDKTFGDVKSWMQGPSGAGGDWGSPNDPAKAAGVAGSGEAGPSGFSGGVGAGAAVNVQPVSDPNSAARIAGIEGGGSSGGAGPSGFGGGSAGGGANVAGLPPPSQVGGLPPPSDREVAPSPRSGEASEQEKKYFPDVEFKAPMDEGPASPPMQGPSAETSGPASSQNFVPDGGTPSSFNDGVRGLP